MAKLRCFEFVFVIRYIYTIIINTVEYTTAFLHCDCLWLPMEYGINTYIHTPTMSFYWHQFYTVMALQHWYSLFFYLSFGMWHKLTYTLYSLYLQIYNTTCTYTHSKSRNCGLVQCFMKFKIKVYSMQCIFGDGGC